MRNLKKFLALALAMVMTFSLMLSASASNVKKDYPDSEQVTDEFVEAVDVLTGLGVFQGDEGGFRPADTITRAEVAAIVYRIATGDVDDKQVKIYADYGNFTDVAPSDWFAGYVGYCANAEIIKGTSATTFDPYSPVTGYQALAMILRVVGYDKNHEFDGPAWQTNVASLSRELGVTDNVKNANFETTLSYPASREVVADLLFQAAAYIPTVTWTSALGYNSKDQIVYGNDNPTLGQKIFNLDYTTYTTVDDWGRPGYFWYETSKFNFHQKTGADKNTVATVFAIPEKTYTVATDECDLAHDLDIKDSATFDLYVNSDTVTTKNYKVVATDTVTKVGGTGRLTEVYRNLKNGKGSVDPRVVMIDTFLAKVNSVDPAVKDAQGHVIIEAQMSLSIYDQPQDVVTLPKPSTPRIVKNSGGKNWEYSKGDMILLNAWTRNNEHNADLNKAAFEAETVRTKQASTEVAKSKVLGLAKSQVAKQTVVYWNTAKHDVGGQSYLDNLCLFLDVLGTKTGSDATWYFDQYGNIIGIGEATKSNYGVITSLYSAFKQGDNSTTGEAEAHAHVKYADGTEADIIIDRFLVSVTAASSNTGTATDGPDNGRAGANKVMLPADETNPPADADRAARSGELTPVYDYDVSGAGVMTAVDTTDPSDLSDDAAVTGDLLVAPVASVNKNAEADPANTTVFNIIEGNLYKFVTAGDGTMTAIEVAGYNAKTSEDETVVENQGIYKGHYNAEAEDDTTLKKSTGWLDLGDKGSARSEDIVIRLNNNTQIMLKEDKKINTYNGLKDLAGDVDIDGDEEVDWVDFDGDGIVDVIYAAAKVQGNITHSLFYYVGGAGQWDGVNKKGTLYGYVDGVATTLDFDNQVEFNMVRNSATGDPATEYGGHLFAVEITNGIVTNLMTTDTGFAPKAAFLCDATDLFTPNAAAINIDTGVKLNDDSPSASTGLAVTADTFKCDTDKGNYPDDVMGIWLLDDREVAQKEVTYNASRGTIVNETDNITYYLNDDSMILGDSLYYLNRNDRDNNVTIVYEVVSTRNIILQIYVDTKADVTSGEVGSTGYAIEIVGGQPDSHNVQFAIVKDGTTRLSMEEINALGITESDIKISMTGVPLKLSYAREDDESGGLKDAVGSIYASSINMNAGVVASASKGQWNFTTNGSAIGVFPMYWFDNKSAGDDGAALDVHSRLVSDDAGAWKDENGDISGFVKVHLNQQMNEGRLRVEVRIGDTWYIGEKMIPTD